MSVIRNQFAVITTVLAAAVANAGTFTVAYPTGFVQRSFQSGLLGPTSYMQVNDNDRYSVTQASLSFGASLVTVTNNTGLTLPAGSTIRLHLDVMDGKGRIPFTIPLPPLATITAADVVTQMNPGIDGVLEHIEFVDTIAASTAAKAATLTARIDAVVTTGGAVALTTANITTKGTVIAGSQITAANVLSRTSQLSIVASAVTAFAEGEGYLVAYIRPFAEDTI